MTYTARITGPGIDHVALITSAEDIAAARAILDKIERDLSLKNKRACEPSESDLLIEHLIDSGRDRETKSNV